MGKRSAAQTSHSSKDQDQDQDQDQYLKGCMLRDRLQPCHMPKGS